MHLSDAAKRKLLEEMELTANFKELWWSSSTMIVIVTSRFLKRYLKAPTYSRALRRIKWEFPKGVKRSSGSNSRIPRMGQSSW